MIKTKHKDTMQKQTLRKRGNNMNEKIYYNAADIAAMLGISMGKSYKILREMNNELSSKGFLTIAGKIPVAYFKEKWYGAAKEVTI
jgi:prophage antirepressor-like protein